MVSGPLHLYLQSWAKSSQAPIKKQRIHQGISLGRGAGNIHGFILPTRIGYCSIINCARCFWYEKSDVDLTCVQPHYYRVCQAEPYYRLDEVVSSSS